MDIMAANKITYELKKFEQWRDCFYTFRTYIKKVHWCYIRHPNRGQNCSFPMLKILRKVPRRQEIIN